MSYPSPGENRDPDRDPTQPGEQPTPPQYPDPYGPSGPLGQQPGPPPHGQHGQYGPEPGHPPQPPYGPPRGTNTMAILALVLAFVFPPAGIVLGHVAKKQIRQTGEQGDGLATAGLVLSYAFTGIYLIACCGLLALVPWNRSTY